ncbi:hypothetical protein KAFR_0E00700 [Kazachstania africana CBS 2517]|uniref:Metallo-beta-lactamase domain-containing protein n=1 Tax=Kazachstania africana (strain ATCC 22294 / BCRC 22015 / CBS 2517 / CECT 1963 / NBRC 1671 / NRRL Y-8276) TaxID=1071382 RepID=H2AV24_KAZAF|nr:hypothetical protein KAFR_0E00700 [Kazachstania africana CBS 2517]CCF58224.1 hypothetical protein KAFR_0E00700 [Kazachstania africana CBS 2517]
MRYSHSTPKLYRRFVLQCRHLSSVKGAKQDSKQKGKNDRFSRHYVIGAFGTFAIPYTIYALYISVTASNEIDRRYKQSVEIEKDGPNFKGTLAKYVPLEVLGRYENPFAEYRIQTVYEFFFNRIVELFQRNRGGIPPDKSQMNQLMPVHKPKWHDSDDPTENNNLNLTGKINHTILDETVLVQKDYTVETIPIFNTWLGQSCNFVFYNGLKILTDPIFTNYLIHETLGPERISQMPCEIEDIPTPDVILVSHNHPDHLDIKSMNFWKDSDVLWIVPKGMEKFMQQHQIKNFIELSWWQTCELEKDNEKYHISCAPSMHWSGRTLLDTNQSLWCSFMLSHHGNPIVFHGGDTGYVQDLFLRIKQRFGQGVRLALLPCGQYCPEWHQQPRHINPQEVLKIMDDLKAQNVLGVHWGTFVLSGEYFLEPKEKLEMLADWKGIKHRCFCPELGKTEKFD